MAAHEERRISRPAFTPDNYFSINATTLSHVARLIREELGEVASFLMTNGLTDSNLRQVAKNLAEKTESAMVDILVKNKEMLFEIKGIKLTEKEINVLQKYIAIACVYISQIVYKALCYCRDFLFDSSDKVGKLPMFNSFTQFYDDTAIEDHQNYISDEDSDDSGNDVKAITDESNKND